MGTQTRLRLPRCPFLDAVRKSGLLTPDDLIGVLSQYDPDQIAAADPIQIATFLVRKKLLTKFQAMQLLNGKTRGFVLGRYKILEGIRQDRVGMVFLAENTDSKQLVAVKVLPTDRVADDTVYRPFLHEVRAAAQVDHASLARILDMGEWNGTHYVVSEYVPAATLDKVVAQSGPLAPNAAAQVIAQAAVGLMQIHKAGLLHRDIKPGNLAVLPDRRVKVLDLGLTHMLENPWTRVTQRINMREYAEEIAHIAPEQAWGCELDARSDIYSLGSTFYFLLTGQAPFPDLAMQSMTERQVRDVPPPSELRRGVSPEIDALVQRMGAKDPNSRFGSAAEVVAALHPWLPITDWVALGLHIGPRPEQSRPKPAAAKKRGLLGWLSRLFSR